MMNVMFAEVTELLKENAIVLVMNQIAYTSVEVRPNSTFVVYAEDKVFYQENVIAKDKFWIASVNVVQESVSIRAVFAVVPLMVPGLVKTSLYVIAMEIKMIVMEFAEVVLDQMIVVSAEVKVLIGQLANVIAMEVKQMNVKYAVDQEYQQDFQIVKELNQT